MVRNIKAWKDNFSNVPYSIIYEDYCGYVCYSYNCGTTTPKSYPNEFLKTAADPNNIEFSYVDGTIDLKDVAPMKCYINPEGVLSYNIEKRKIRLRTPFADESNFKITSEALVYLEKELLKRGVI